MPFSFFGKSDANKQQTGEHQAPVSSPQAQKQSLPPSIWQRLVGNQAAGQLPAEAPSAYLSDDELEAIFQKEYYQPLKAEIMFKLGIGRGQWRRSEELNKFRDKLKAAARGQSNEDIDNLMEEHEKLKDKSNIGKAFYNLAAKKEAYSLAKESVDDVMEQEAEKIIAKFMPEDHIRQYLRQAANAVSSLQTANHSDLKRIRKKAGETAGNKAQYLLSQIQESAIDEARKLVKGDAANLDKQAHSAQIEILSSTVAEQVKSSKIGSRAITIAIESGSLNSGLAQISRIIDKIVPNEGESASLSCELKIPIAKGPAYTIISFEAEVERDDGIEAETQVGIGIGAEAGILDFNFQLGLFAQAKAEQASGVMNLISYGMYRQVSRIKPKIAQHLWGMNGKSGQELFKEAELWASAIEDQELSNKEASVTIGVLAQLTAGLDLGFNETEIGFTEKIFSKYDKESIEALTDNHFGDNTNIESLQEKIEQMRKAEVHASIGASLSTSFDFGPLGSIDAEAAGELTFTDRLEEIEASIDIALPLQTGHDVANWAIVFSKMYPQSIRTLSRLTSALTKKAPKAADPAQDALDKQAAQQAITDNNMLEEQFTSMQNQVKTISSMAEPEEESSLKSQTQTVLGLNFEYQRGKIEDGKKSNGEWELSIHIGKKKSFELDAGIFSVEAEKTKRLAKLTYKKDKDSEKAAASTKLYNMKR